MKTFLVIIVLVALVIIGFWLNNQVNQRENDIVELKKQLVECNDKYTADIAVYKKCDMEKIVTISAYEVQIKELKNSVKLLQEKIDATPATTVPTVKMQKINGVPIAPVKPAVQLPQVVKPDNTEQVQKLNSELSILKGESLDLYNKKTAIEGKIKLENSRLLSNGSSKQYWYYVSEGSSNLHPDNGKYDPSRPIKWVTKTTKDETRANTVNALKSELTGVISQRSTIESQIKDKENQLSSLK